MSSLPPEALAALLGGAVALLLGAAKLVSWFVKREVDRFVAAQAAMQAEVARTREVMLRLVERLDRLEAREVGWDRRLGVLEAEATARGWRTSALRLADLEALAERARIVEGKEG